MVGQIAGRLVGQGALGVIRAPDSGLVALRSCSPITQRE